MKLQLLTAAFLSLGMIAGPASLAQSAGMHSGTATSAHATLTKKPASRSLTDTSAMHSVANTITTQKPCGGDYTKIRQANGTCRHIGP
jgi:hypothetical protein